MNNGMLSKTVIGMIVREVKQPRVIELQRNSEIQTLCHQNFNTIIRDLISCIPLDIYLQRFGVNTETNNT